MTESSRKLAVIGLDGVRLDVVRRFKDDLPYLGEMLESGASGHLETVLPGPHSGPAWTSFSTGVNPGKHGIGDWRIKDGYTFKPATGEDIPQYRFWDYLSDEGYTVGIFNIPLTSPPSPVNGVLVSSWTQSSDNYTYPRSFENKLDAIGYETKADFSSPDDDIQNLLDSIQTRREAFEMYLEEYDWNLLVGMFYETEQAHHQFASFLDPEHTLYDANYESQLKQVYKKVDEELAILAKRLGDAPIIVMSDHGFCPIYERIHLNRILEQYGYFSPSANSTAGGRPESLLQRSFLHSVQSIKSNSFVRKSVNVGLTIPLLSQCLEKLVSQYQTLEYVKQVEADWGRTVAFNGYEHGGIFINTNQNHPEGSVAKQEVESIVDSIIRDLNEDDFLQARVEGIYRREELFDGPNLSELPEIIINFSEGYLGSSGYEKRLSRGPSELSNIGFHTQEGIILADGTDIKDTDLSGAGILDLAPTVLHYFGQPIPSNMDGTPLEELFLTQSPLANIDNKTRSPKYTSTLTNLTDKERQSVEQHLQEMGYR